MKRRVMIFGLLACIFSAASGAAQQTSQPLKAVPCRVFGSNANCVAPIIEGVVDGQWIGLISHYNGTNGGPDALNVVTIGFGGNGLQTTLLPAIKPDGRDGDRMDASFRKGKLIVSNAIYLPGEAHCCFTHKTIRRFGFHHRHLSVEREATVPNATTAAGQDAALEKGPHLF